MMGIGAYGRAYPMQIALVPVTHSVMNTNVKKNTIKGDDKMDKVLTTVCKEKGLKHNKWSKNEFTEKLRTIQELERKRGIDIGTVFDIAYIEFGWSTKDDHSRRIDDKDFLEFIYDQLYERFNSDEEAAECIKILAEVSDCLINRRIVAIGPDEKEEM